MNLLKVKMSRILDMSIQIVLLLIGVGLVTSAVIQNFEFTVISENAPDPPPHTIYPRLKRKRRETDENKHRINDHDAGFAALLSVTGEFKAELNHTVAEHGDHCTPSDNLSKDFCENAYYPQKGRMFCRTPGAGGTSTCECKFSKKEDAQWEQMTYDKKLKLCLSPERGRCYDLLLEFSNGTSKYYTRLIESDKQCDNTGLKKNDKGFLVCTKPHPRRFVSFDKRGFYCLRKEDRSAEKEYLEH